MANPYDPPPAAEPPQTAAEDTPVEISSAKGTVWSSFSFWVATMFAGSAAYFVYLARELRSTFPDLRDPSPDVDGYWPAIAHLIYQWSAGLSTVIALVLLAVWASIRRRASK